MKVCVVQTRPIKGDIQRNVYCHERFVDLSVSHGAEIVIFPELSITGYEPTLVEGLATNEDDCRFDIFQNYSDSQGITIGIGCPTRNDLGVCVSVVLFRPHKPRQLYSKKYLHPDEEAFFVSGGRFIGLVGNEERVALAICYELSVQEHAANAFAKGARIYVASVAKSVSGINSALNRLAEIAQEYSMSVLMANCIGQSDGFRCAGKSSAWNRSGQLLAQLDDESEGIIIVDTANDAVLKIELDIPADTI